MYGPMSPLMPGYGPASVPVVATAMPPLERPTIVRRVCGQRTAATGNGCPGRLGSQVWPGLWKMCRGRVTLCSVLVASWTCT